MKDSIYSVKYYNQDNLPSPWNTADELHFILSGKVTVSAGDLKHDVECEDIIFINTNDLRLFSGSEWESLAISFQRSRLPENASRLSKRFELCSAGNTYSTKYDFVRYCIYNLVDLYKKEPDSYAALGLFFALLDHISDAKSTSSITGSYITKKNQEKLSEILAYINVHYTENLTLNEVADHFGLTSPYFSSFFKKNTGSTFSEYYNEIRLNHAVNSLLSTNDSIEAISLGNGFGDARSFTALFKKRYNMLPTAYRKHNRTDTRVLSEDHSFAISESSNDFNRNLSDYPALTKYKSVFREKNDFYSSAIENPRIIDNGTVSYTAAGTRLTHNYRTMICVGSAKQFLYKEVQDMLTRAQKEIGFKYVKFHGLLSDDMMVYHEDSNGNPHYSFTFIDKAFDFLLSIGIKPLCQLSFMPIELAEDPSRLVDFFHYNTSPPKSLQKWEDLVKALMYHFLERYGEAEVLSWLFCVWNEPDETVDQFSWPDKHRFFEFYEHTYKAVKGICPMARFGTPSMLLSVQHEFGWAGDFFIYTSDHDCIPDFLNIHYYDNSIFDIDSTERYRNEAGFTAENMESSFPLTVDPYAFRKFIDNISALALKYNMKNLQVYLTEWNLTISHRDLINDTCFKSCHLIKNLLENYDLLQSYSYWCLTDYIEELQIPNKLYHGGLGLFTYNGIPKANYTALQLLRKLGNTLLDQGNGYFITKGTDRLCIVLYNYEHYSKLFASGERMLMTETNRYSGFEEMNTAQSTIHISDLDYSRALVTHYYVNQLAGSSYDAWAQMGTDTDYLSKEDMDILEYHSHPGILIHKRIIEDGNLNIHASLLPLEVRVIDVKLFK